MIELTSCEPLAAAFGTLGRLHREPPNDTILTTLHDLLDEWPLPSTTAAEEGLARLRRSRQQGEDAETIRRDHDRLYGVSAVATVSPYESVHRGDDGLVFDQATLEVRQAYAALGLQAPELNREPDDHLGLEFDFVAQGLLRMLTAADLGDESEAERLGTMVDGFIRDHLLSWAPDMLESAVTAARTDFMAGVALLSLGALESVRELWETRT